MCRGCSFRGSMLAWANLRSADFTGADFTHAILSESDFRGALLMHAGLTGTYLKPVIANPDQFLNRPGLVRGHDVTQKEHHGYQPLRLRNPPAGGAPVLRGTYYPAQRSQRDPEAGPSFFRPDRARPQTEVIVDFLRPYQHLYSIERMCRLLNEHELRYFTSNVLLLPGPWFRAHPLPSWTRRTPRTGSLGCGGPIGGSTGEENYGTPPTRQAGPSDVTRCNAS